MTLTAVIQSEGPALYVGVILYYNEHVCSFAYIIINKINKSRFWLFGFIAPKTLSYLSFRSFDFERHLMKVIPETYRAQ